MLSFPEYLAHLDANTHLMGAAAARGLDAKVPGCPGWTVRDLVLHVAQVQIQKADIVEHGHVDTWPAHPEPPTDADPIEWYRSGADRLYRVLAEADPTAPAKTWAEEQTVGFWIRRMAHEAAVHRVDAEQAHGYESAVNAGLAVDGVAELFDVFITGYPDWGEYTADEAVVRVETGGRSWTARFGRFTGSKSDRTYDLPTLMLEEGAEPGSVISGEPDRVLLWMWGRAPLSDVLVAGDIDLAHRLREVCSI
ncbi:MAG: maleylpyruvate isomerase family mycothiol-dependent enzyme [Acidimicrobiia bacterium]|nr:maleylpyruvate isomerase family mycothiol-dependent enzyme [Acidimicrobiia bacterium]